MFRPLVMVVAALCWVCPGSPAVLLAQSPASAVEPPPAAPSPQVPPYYLSPLHLDGTIEDDRAVLNITIEVTIEPDDVWLDVPLGMRQLHVQQKTYVGEGEEARDAVPREDGLHWWFRGKGTHQLKLTAWAPVTRKPPFGSQLQLSLPSLPEQFPALLTLRVPGHRLSVKSLPETTLRVTPADDGTTLISADILDPRLDVSWQELPEATSEFARARSALSLYRLDGADWRLKVEQRIEPAGGDVAALTVRLPSGFQVESLTDAENRPLMYELLLSRPGWAQVTLPEPVAGPVEIVWRFKAAFPREGGLVALDGLAVEGADLQNGQIRVYDLAGYRTTWDARQSQSVRRIDVSESAATILVPRDARTDPLSLERTPSAPVKLAFDFLQEDFRLQLIVDKTEPVFGATADYFLTVSREHLDLDAVFKIDTDVGVVESLQFVWANMADQGWTVESGERSSEHQIFPVSLPSDLAQAAAAGLLPATLVEPQTGRFTVRLRATMPRVSTDGEGFGLSLPRVVSSRARPSRLFVLGDDEVEPTLFSESGTVAEPVADVPTAPPYIDRTFVGRTPSLFEIKSEERQFRVVVTLHARTIDTVSTVRVAEFLASATGDRPQVTVEQSIRYRIAYGRLSAVKLRLPPALAAAIPSGPDILSRAFAFRLLRPGLDEVPLTKIEGTGTELRLTLPEPLSGEFTVVVRWALPEGAAEESRDGVVAAVLPILAPTDQPPSSTFLEAPGPDQFSLQVADEATGDWERVPTSPSYPVWRSLEPRTEVPVALSRRTDHLTQRYTIELAFLRSVVRAGEAVTFCEYHIQHPPRQVIFSVSGEPVDFHFEWNGQEILGEFANNGQVVLPVPDDRSETSNRLTVRFSAPIPHSRWASRLDLPAPRFPRQVWVEQSVWELALPPPQQLFTAPMGMSPRFSWVRKGLLWRRELTDEYNRWREATVTLSRHGSFDSGAENVYAFSSVGVVDGVAFSVMNRSLIVLIGAGMTLLLGFVFRRVPQTRNVVTLLVLALGFSLAGLWWLEPMQLLLQPALLGVALALLAAALDSVSTRNGPADLSTILPLPPPRQSTGSSVVRAERAPIVVESTVFRPAGASDSGEHG